MLLGRGSDCINTGGEKVWPEEVEEVLKEHPGVDDAVVVGVPDDEWGEIVAAVVAATGGDQPPDADALGEWVGARLAGYKRPRRIVFADEVSRTTVGKLDYEWAPPRWCADDAMLTRRGARARARRRARCPPARRSACRPR